MLDIPQNTLAYFLSNPLFKPMNINGLKVDRLGQEYDAFKKRHGGMSAPEKDAVSFYFLNHVFHILKTKYQPLEPLPEDVVEMLRVHQRETTIIAKRMFFYNMVIAVEEARFIPDQSEAFCDMLDSRYGSEFAQWAKKDFQAGGLTGFRKFDMTAENYARAMTAVFSFGKWQPGFGGKGWVPIASAIQSYVNGRVSLERMTDESFSLSHNNGSMFNKGHFYHRYTNMLYQILDIQDSGQILQWVGQNLNHSYVSSEVKQVFETLKKRFPEECAGKVDQKLISDSSKKRQQKEKALQAQQQASWNNQAIQQKAPPQQKINNIVMDALGMGPKR